MAEERGVWGRQVEFILTMIGYAVGLGNVWRFPYLCFKNGGGAFLIPYVICLLLLGIPMFALECAFGQYGGKGPITIWSMNPTFKGLGIAMVLVATLVFIYYNVIIAWALNFLVASFTTDLPWMKCDECECLLYNKNITDQQVVEDMKLNNSLGVPCMDLTLDDNMIKSTSEIYFFNEVLKDSGDIGTAGDVQWQLLVANFVAYMIIFFVLLKGIQSLGKVVYFTATFPYILLTILLVRCAMLEGASDGIKYYLQPDWEKLKDAQVWSDAAVQIFFSLSACMGGLIAMSSYNRFSNNILRDAFMIPVINCLTSLYAGFVVFSTLGNMAHTKGLPIENVTEAGPGLAFVVYPEAIANMPISTLWAILFFFMIAILGFSTQFSAAETIMTSVIDEFPDFFRTRKREILWRIFVPLAAWILGIPLVTQGGKELLDLVDAAVLGFPMLIVGLFEYITIIHIYGYSNFASDVKAMLGFSPFLYFRITWVIVAPFLLGVVIVFKAYQMETFDPPWVGLLYYLIVVFIVMWIPVWFLWYTCRHGVWQMMKPKKYWTDRRSTGHGHAAENGDAHMHNNIGGHVNKSFEKGEIVLTSSSKF